VMVSRHQPCSQPRDLPCRMVLRGATLGMPAASAATKIQRVMIAGRH